MVNNMYFVIPIKQIIVNAIWFCLCEMHSAENMLSLRTAYLS